MHAESHEKRRTEKTEDYGSYVAIATSRGDLLVSKKDYPKIKDYTWLCNGNKLGSPTPYAKVPVTGAKKRSSIHTKDIVYPHWIIYGGNQDFYFLNRNPLDIRRENVVAGNFPLRVRGYSQTSGIFPNVRPTSLGKFVALIRIPGKGYNYLGVFNTEKEAAEEIIHNIKLRYHKEAKQIISAMKKLFAYDAPEKAKEWGYV